MLRKIINRIHSALVSWNSTYLHGLQTGKNVRFRKQPYILRHKDATISIGDGTLINSSNRGYHVNMFQKCKLHADRAGARITIGKNTRVHGSCIHAYTSISIGDNCLIAANCQIVDGNGHELLFDRPQERIHSTDRGKPIAIGDNVWIAAGCTILGGTVIGEGSVIAAGSVVKGEVPPRSLYGGNPAKLIKSY